MSHKKVKIDAEVKTVFEYLNDLRESGETNMFGAGSYVKRKFPHIDGREASNLVERWMLNFDAEGNYEEEIFNPKYHDNSQILDKA